MIKVFYNEQFGQIRVAQIQDKPFFCLTDVCKMLDVRQNSVIDRLKQDENNIIKLDSEDSIGRTHKMNYISESNLYRVIIRSDKEIAIKIQDWICEEVLPSIRKTGKYEMGNETKGANEETEEIKILSDDFVEDKAIKWSIKAVNLADELYGAALCSFAGLYKGGGDACEEFRNSKQGKMFEAVINISRSLLSKNMMAKIRRMEMIKDKGDGLLY